MEFLHKYKYNIFGAILVVVGLLGALIFFYVFFTTPPDPAIQEYANYQNELKAKFENPTVMPSSFISNFSYDVDTLRGTECTPNHFQSTDIEAISNTTVRVKGIATTEYEKGFFAPKRTRYEERTYEVKKYGDIYRAELDVASLGEWGGECHVVVTLTSQNIPE